MSTQANSRWQRVARLVRTIPTDLLVVVGLAWLVAAASAVGPVGPVTRFVLGGLLLFFLPGYALLAAAFPGEAERRSTDVRRAVSPHTGITFGERLALSFGTSVALLPVFALVVAAIDRRLSTAATVGVLSAFVVLASAIAFFRRVLRPAGDRFTLPVARLSSRFRDFLDRDSAADTAINVVLVASVLVGASAATYALAVPQPGPEYTTFSLLTRNDTTGELVAADYPTNLSPGQPAELIVNVENHRGERTEYTVVAEMERMRTDGDSARVVSDRELSRFSAALGPSQTWRRPHTVSPQQTGENLRLSYYLYRGDAPADAGPESAHRQLHLWVNVTSGAAGAVGGTGGPSQ